MKKKAPKKVYRKRQVRRNSDARAELEILAARFEESQAIAKVGSWEYDVAANIIWWSPETFRMFGCDPRDGAPSFEDHFAQIHPDDRQLWLKTVGQAKVDGEPYSFEFRTVLPDGTVRMIQSKGRGFKDGAGKVVRLAGTAQDITERSRVEEQLSAARAFSESIIANIPNMIFMKDAQDLRFTLFNRAGEELLGLKAEDLIGKSDYDFFPKEQADFFIKKDREVIANGKLVDIPEEMIKTSSGETRYLHTKKIPLRTADGKARYLLGISEDVTAQKATKEEIRRYIDDLESSKAEILRQSHELEEARDRAEASGRAKGEFLANMSHEIRTPMNGILGMSELLLDTELSVQQRDYVETILGSSETLLTIINDVLDFSKIEARKLELTMGTFSITDLLNQLVATLGLSIAEKSIEVSITIDPLIPKVVGGDAVRMRQVLINLLNNAVKFTPAKGAIAVTANLKEKLPNGTLLIECVVSDNGVGISEEHQQRIFDPFFQVDASSTREHGGTGLGLSIAAQLVGLMGGTLSCRSKLGKGSTFSFTARVEERVESAQVVRPQEVSMQASNRHVLIVEDNAVNQKLAKALLEKDGYQVTIAASGQEAVEQHRKGNFDIILMDIQMPVLDGVQATAMIRESEEKAGRHTPIIALTAHAMTGDKEKYLAAGMDGYLSKPIRREQLRALLKVFSAP